MECAIGGSIRFHAPWPSITIPPDALHVVKRHHVTGLLDNAVETVTEEAIFDFDKVTLQTNDGTCTVADLINWHIDLAATLAKFPNLKAMWNQFEVARKMCRSEM